MGLDRFMGPDDATDRKKNIKCKDPLGIPRKTGRLVVDGRQVVVDTSRDLPLDDSSLRFLHYYTYTVYISHWADGVEKKVPLVHTNAIVYTMVKGWDGKYWFREVRDSGSLETLVSKFLPNGIQQEDPRVKRLSVKFYEALGRIYKWNTRNVTSASD